MTESISDAGAGFLESRYQFLLANWDTENVVKVKALSLGLEDGLNKYGEGIACVS